jgi:Flp pilus assembly protein TadG
MKRRTQFDLLRDEGGSSLIEMALMLPLFALILCGSVDFGRAYYLAIEVAGAAHAGAIYGSQYPTDTTGMQNAARADAQDVPNLSVATPTYGCECADGSLYSASCASALKASSCPNSLNVVYRVNVTVNANYVPLFPWPAFSNSASMRSM